MSSPLEGRIRALAREEAAEALRGAGAPTTIEPSVRGLQEQINDLHNHLHQATTVIGRLEARIDALEKAAGPEGQATQSAARRTRKASAE